MLGKKPPALLVVLLSRDNESSLFNAGMSTQEHDLQRRREVVGEAGVRHRYRGLKEREREEKQRREKK